MSLPGRLVMVTRFSELEEAERAGERLIEAGMNPVLRDKSLLVPEEDAERAAEILGTDELLPLPEEPAPSPPICPSCGDESPRSIGGRKALMLVIAVALSLHLAWTLRSPYPLLGGMAVVGIAAWMLPEFACEQCGHRWSRDVRREE
jgi:hypothetical protein